MTGRSKPYKWTKVKGGIPAVAIVSLEVEPGVSNCNEIIEHYSGNGYIAQGHVEEISEHGYNSWKLGAQRGLIYAFSLIDTNWIVHINKIEGLNTDTNPAVVGYTVLRAFFDKINFELTEKQIMLLEEFVMSSWIKPCKELIPDFFNLTFTEYKSE